MRLTVPRRCRSSPRRRCAGALEQDDQTGTKLAKISCRPKPRPPRSAATSHCSLSQLTPGCPAWSDADADDDVGEQRGDRIRAGRAGPRQHQHPRQARQVGGEHEGDRRDHQRAEQVGETDRHHAGGLATAAGVLVQGDVVEVGTTVSRSAHTQYSATARPDSRARWSRRSDCWLMRAMSSIGASAPQPPARCRRRRGPRARRPRGATAR